MKKIVNLKIKGSDWLLEFTDKIDNVNDSDGLTSYSDRKILILNQDLRLMVRTLVHELFHAILYECGEEDYSDEASMFKLETFGVELLDRINDIQKAIAAEIIHKNG